MIPEIAIGARSRHLPTVLPMITEIAVGVYLVSFTWIFAGDIRSSH